MSLEDSFFDACAELVALHAAAVTADHHAGHETTARTIGASLDAHAQLRDACEVFRRKRYPHAGKVFAVFGEVYVSSPGGRRITCIYPS